MPQYWMISDCNNGGTGTGRNVAGLIMATVRGDNSAQVKAQLATESAAKSAKVRNKLVAVKAAHAKDNAQEVNQTLDAVEAVFRTSGAG